MRPKLTTQYHAELIINNNPNTTCKLDATELKDIEDAVRSQLKGTLVRFQDVEDTNTSLVFGDQNRTSETPVGWILKYEVPEAMSIRHLTNQAAGARQAA